MAARKLPLAAAALGLSALVSLWLATRPRPAALVASLSAASPGQGSAAPSPSLPALPRRSLGQGVARPGAPSMFRLDPRHTNRSPFVAPQRPRVAWAYDTGGPVAAAPVVSGSLVIVASLSGRVAALSVDGSPRWVVELGERIYGSPLVVGESIYLGVDKGKLVVLHAGNGAVRSTLDVDGDADTAPVPLPSGGVAFAAGKTLYALRPDGAVRFRHKLRRKVFSSPAVSDDGSIAFGGQDGALHLLGPDGSPKARVSLGADADASPSIGDDGTIYAGSDEGAVWAVRPDGVARWKHPVGGFVRGPLSVARDGAVLCSTYGPAPAVLALDPGDGHEIWRFGVRGTGAREFGIHGAPLEDARGLLLFGGQDDRVYALDPDGKLVWKLELGGDIDAALVLASDGVLYAGSEDGKLYALRDEAAASPSVSPAVAPAVAPASPAASVP